MKRILNKYPKIVTFIVVLLITSAVSFAAFVGLDRPKTGTDDADITFVYARNFAQGNGFVYNVGGEKVEGFTSMLWTLITSVFFFFFSSPERLILLFNIFIVAAGLSLIVFALNKIFEDKIYKRTKLFSLASIVFLIWSITSPSFIAWSVISLMEVGIYGFIFLGLTFVLLKLSQRTLYIGEVIFFNIMQILLVLVRPESLLIGPFFIVLFFIVLLLKDKSAKSAVKLTITPLISFLGTLILLVLFRLSYFGYPLPNTFYAKVSNNLGSNINLGFDYFSRFINSNIFIYLSLMSAVLLGFFIIVRLGKRKFLFQKFSLSNFELFCLVISLISLLGFSLPVYNGGDYFNQFRFYQQFWPLVILPTISLPYLLFRDFKFNNIKLNFENLIFIVAAIFLAFNTAGHVTWNNIVTEVKQTISHEFKIAYFNRLQANSISSFYDKIDTLPSIGVITAGGTKYAYRGEVIDLLGLNNTLIAHSSKERHGIQNHASFSKDAFYKLLPDIIHPGFTSSSEIIVPEPAKPGGFWFVVLQGIQNDDEFLELYSPSVVYNNERDQYLFGFYKKDFLNKIERNDNYEIFE